MTSVPDLLLLLAILMVMGAFAGILAGLLGVGGGVVLVPAYLALFTAAGYGEGEIMRVCLATSLATIIVTSARSVMAHHRRGAVDWDILRGWAPYIGTGALVGVLVVSHLPSETLKLIFGVLVTVIALGIPSIFAGAIITEQVFKVNGIGAALIGAIHANDLPMVQTLAFIFAILIVTFNLIADVLYGLLDPRIRYD